MASVFATNVDGRVGLFYSSIGLDQSSTPVGTFVLLANADWKHRKIGTIFPTDLRKVEFISYFFALKLLRREAV